MELNASLHSPIAYRTNLQNASNRDLTDDASRQKSAPTQINTNSELDRSKGEQRASTVIEGNVRNSRVEVVNQNARSNANRVLQEPARAEIIRENENDVTELKPLVINQSQNPATRAFASVATQNSDFRLIDIYV